MIDKRDKHGNTFEKQYQSVLKAFRKKYPHAFRREPAMKRIKDKTI